MCFQKNVYKLDKPEPEKTSTKISKLKISP